MGLAIQLDHRFGSKWILNKLYRLGYTSGVLFHVCEGDMDEYMDIFSNTKATKEAVIQAGTVMFQHVYRGPDSTFGKIRYNMFSMKAAAEPLKPETLPPTEGTAAQHSLCDYLQTRDWILLQNMSQNPIDYGWTLGVHEPVRKLYSITPDEQLEFTSCNCHGYFSKRRFHCKKNGAMFISLCGVCKSITCRNDSVGSEADIDSDC